MFSFDTAYEQDNQIPKMRAQFLTGVAFNLASHGNIPTNDRDRKLFLDQIQHFTDDLFARVEAILEEMSDEQA